MQQKTRSHDVCLLRYWVLAQTIVSHFRPLFAFFAILPHYWHQKLKFGKNVKKRLEILSFYTCVPLIKIIWCMVPEIWTSTDRMILSLWAIFALLPPPQTTRKIKINKKNEKNTWRYHHFTQLYQKLWSYAILFLRYGICQMYLLFFILGYFLTFYLPNDSKNENLKKMKKLLEIHHLTQGYQNSWSYAILLLRYSTWWM